MMRLRIALVASVAAAALAAAPAAHADPWGDGGSVNWAGTCGTSSGNEGQGGTAGTNSQVCLTAGVVNIGPSSGQDANLVGPTIAPGTVVGGPVIVAAGDVAVNGVAV
jgi:hypothetical protein